MFNFVSGNNAINQNLYNMKKTSLPVMFFMAIVQNPIIGRAKNKLANVIFSTNHGANVLRSKPIAVRNPQSAAQMSQRTLIKILTSVLSNCLPIIQLGFRGFTSKMAAYSYALKVNAPVAITGNYPSQTFNFSTAEFAKGNID